MRKRLTATSNVEYSLQVLEMAVNDLPESGTQEKAKRAIVYLQNTVKGRKQARRCRECSHPIIVWP